MIARDCGVSSRAPTVVCGAQVGSISLVAPFCDFFYATHITLLIINYLGNECVSLMSVSRVCTRLGHDTR